MRSAVLAKVVVCGSQISAAVPISLLNRLIFSTDVVILIRGSNFFIK